jgi:hypothetical protein
LLLKFSKEQSLTEAVFKQDLRIFTKYSRFGDWGLVIGEWEKSLNHQHFGTI